MALACQQVAAQQLVMFDFNRAVGDVGSWVKGGTKEKWADASFFIPSTLHTPRPSFPPLLPLFALSHNYSWCLHCENTPDARFCPTFCCFPKVWGSIPSKNAGVVRHYKLPPAPLCVLKTKTRPNALYVKNLRRYTIYKKLSSIQLFVFLCCFFTHKREQEDF